MSSDMLKALQHSSLHALLMMLSKALSREGYGDIQILDRRQNKEKSRESGHELLCLSRFGGLTMRVVVKVVRQPLRRRMFDEFAGVILRTKASFGLLVSTHQANEKVMKWQEAYACLRLIPIDGNRLVQLLQKHQIGVRKSGTPDFAFLDALEGLAHRIQDFLTEEAP
ncbi:MAG: hypothetical protein JST40_12735 [Armatimonadetes bacterium]|nr:hypothetical protein [Armatimonadota bacterium]